MPGWDAERKTWMAVIVGAALIAVVSARPFAGSWNDGSRLATVESLVDRQTLVIDDSLFLRKSPPQNSPYEDGYPLGTFDKLRIDGHWYSDKSPVPALLMAIIYQLLQWITGLTANVHPHAFCYWMTVLSSGVAYIVAVAGIHHLGRMLRLPARLRLGATVSFALSTLAVVYVRYTNNHILLLGVAVALLVCHVRLAQADSPRMSSLVSIGTLAGLAYSIDLGVGPPLWLCSLALVGWRTRSIKAMVVVVVATLPWLAAHHAVNYIVGGTIKPANAVPEYLAWPGSPFKNNPTGHWSHADIGHCASYAVQLLVGKKGFLGHNLPLMLVIPAALCLWRTKTTYLAEALFCVAVCGGVWLVYAVGSTNYAGACCSIRWFVPLVGLGYFVVMLGLREAPGFAIDFAILSIGGAALMASAWPEGPWRMTLLPAYWPIVSVTLAACAVHRWRGWRIHVASPGRTAALRHNNIFQKTVPGNAGASKGCDHVAWNAWPESWHDPGLR